jgi:hypothetical protein
MDKNEQKAQVYNNLLFQHGRVAEQIRLIKADKFELNENDIKQIKVLEMQQQRIMMEVNKLF